MEILEGSVQFQHRKLSEKMSQLQQVGSIVYLDLLLLFSTIIECNIVGPQ
jgi:hypothetical protein